MMLRGRARTRSWPKYRSSVNLRVEERRGRGRRGVKLSFIDRRVPRRGTSTRAGGAYFVLLLDISV